MESTPSQNRDERGATAVEHGLMVGLITIAIMGAVATFGTAVGGLFALIPPWVWEWP